MKISLIIPAYNEEHSLGECLQFATKWQDEHLLEIIVVDNASTDRTSDVARQFGGVKVVREERKGTMWARQRGIDEAHGDILAFVDADTRMPGGWYARIVKEFSLDENLACVSGPYTHYDLPLWQDAFTKLYWIFLAMPVYFLTQFMVVGGNFAIRKSIVEKMGGFDTSIRFYGDDTSIARNARRFGRVKFSLSFIMPTSGRRLVDQGFFKIGFLYVMNFIWELFFHRPFSREYKDVR